MVRFPQLIGHSKLTIGVNISVNAHLWPIDRLATRSLTAGALTPLVVGDDSMFWSRC